MSRFVARTRSTSRPKADQRPFRDAAPLAKVEPSRLFNGRLMMVCSPGYSALADELDWRVYAMPAPERERATMLFKTWLLSDT